VHVAQPGKMFALLGHSLSSLNSLNSESDVMPFLARS
jgi:hypothetical protein